MLITMLSWILLTGTSCFSMLYILQATCVSPQPTYGLPDFSSPRLPVANRFHALEPDYQGIPTGILRRMGKAIRLAVGAALPMLKAFPKMPEGIIIGTGNGGMEDSIRFLDQIIAYDEGMLTPSDFVQSTTNAIAAQLGLLTGNKGYNSTHVQRGLAFEHALLDASLLLRENKSAVYLVGGVDEISASNFNIDLLAGWFKKEIVDAGALYTSGTPGSIAGEGAAMFLVSLNPEGAMARVTAMELLHTEDAGVVARTLHSFLEKNGKPGEPPDVFISGENGDIRNQACLEAVEAMLPADAAIARYKHVVGDYATVSAVALWLGTFILQQQAIPAVLVKKSGNLSTISRMLLYNNYKNFQHSFLLLESVVAGSPA